MKGWTRILVTPVVAWLLGAGCSSYNGTGESCDRLSDCNPGKTCGDMVRCVDGRCDSGNTIHLPCDEDCTTGADCPAGMHCRLDGQTGTCVADGTCAEVGECLGLPHDDCIGSFECRDGACEYVCLDITSCSQDGDCVLADRGCCCGFEPGDYVSIRGDRLQEWEDREECRSVPCPDEACQIPPGLSAVCESGQCTTDLQEENWWTCQQDPDCVKVPADCCGCQAGGGEEAIAREFEAAYLSELEEACANVDPQCAGYDACTDWPAVCHDEVCRTLGESCGCEPVWDPVCLNDGATWSTLGSECEADCTGLPWDYHGRCECQMDCFRSDPVCAMNGQTYWCGPLEVECNGQVARYPAPCSPECDLCESTGEQVAVCTEYFTTLEDKCFAGCQGLDWWHEGACLEGEGNACGGHQYPACRGNDLFCLVPPGCLECSGFCILLGHCMKPEDCLEQPIDHDDCAGEWICEDHECLWKC